MHDDSLTPPNSPEHLRLLLDSLPATALLRFIKKDIPLSQVVFHGFTPREKSLALPVVAQRLEAELLRQPQLVEDLQAYWMETFAPLLRQVTAPDFFPTPQQLQALRRKFGEKALRYALCHTEREELRALAEPDAILMEPAPVAPAAHEHAERAHTTSPHTQVADLRRQLQKMEEERNGLKTALSRLETQLSERTQQLAAAKKLAAEAEHRLLREQRRIKKAEDELGQLRKELSQQKKAPPVAPILPAVIVPQEIIDTLTDAIAVLQRGLTVAGVASEQDTPSASAPPSSSSRAVPIRKPVTKAAGVITLPAQRGSKTYTVEEILAGLRTNDSPLLEQLRNGIAFLAQEPQRERAAVAALTKAGVPAALLNGPLRPAVIDGSNIANLDPESPRARIDLLYQVRRAAWREGYFPVTIIVDASLRHQLDRGDQLMALVESGEIIMAPAGTSADELLIEETVRQHAVLITNDRMTDWPAARDLEKRRVEIISGAVTLGSFHRSEGLWFH